MVVDSFGIGGADDAELFGDKGSNTLNSIKTKENFKAENLKRLGLFNIDGVLGGIESPIGVYARLKEKKLFLLDMDGTIYLDDDLFDGVHEFLAYVKKIGGKYIFMTNNSSKSVDKYIEKLDALGICACPDDFLTSTNATVLDLKKSSHKKIYALGRQ